MILQEHNNIIVDDTIKLKLLDVIGQGSFGTFYSASWQGSVIAAKVIPVNVGSYCGDTRNRNSSVSKHL